MIVAINKIDKPDARPERVRTEHAAARGPGRIARRRRRRRRVSAKNKTNLDKLLR